MRVHLKKHVVGNNGDNSSSGSESDIQPSETDHSGTPKTPKKFDDGSSSRYGDNEDDNKEDDDKEEDKWGKNQSKTRKANNSMKKQKTPTKHPKT